MNIWDEDQKPALWLLTPDELKKLPTGVEIESITGNKKIVGVDFDMQDEQDTRFGHTAYGIRDLEEKIKNNPDIFLFALK